MAGKFGRDFFRYITTYRGLQESLRVPLKGGDTAVKHVTSKKWKMIFFLVSCPAIALATLNCLLTEKPKRPEFVKYSYLRVRTSKFPWGDGNKSLFHNPHTNALPDGYETEEH